ncbi:MAG: hypothetical protein DME36_08985 [Verrucomicrobia bacterium]|nr:MAG: hypothetical protein DME36_08985 [Verrucomicrobiota bacterium]
MSLARTEEEDCVMRVLITGAAGFIGQFLAKHCVEAGCSVLGIDHREPEAGWTGTHLERCDVRDATHLSELVSAFRPDRVFHLALACVRDEGPGDRRLFEC